MAVFSHFLHLARSLQSSWHGRRINRAAGSGRQKMTYNLSSLQNVAISAIGAIFAATLFVTAAVGPATQFI